MDYSRDVKDGVYGAEAQLYCEVTDSWDIVKKKKTTQGRCFHHIGIIAGLVFFGGREIPRFVLP